MLWARSKPVEVYLGQTMVGCRGLDDLGDRWAEVAHFDDALTRLADWMSSSAAPMRARVWLGSTLARPFVLAANCGARNAIEARELASTAAADLTGMSRELKVWLAPWGPGQTALAVAMEQHVLAALTAIARTRGSLRVISVRPWWNQVLDAVVERSRTQSRSIGWTLAEPDGLAHGRIASGEVLEAAFEMRRAHDPDATIVRRRLAVGWGDVDGVEHFTFTGSAAQPSPLFAIGGATHVQVDEVAV